MDIPLKANSKHKYMEFKSCIKQKFTYAQKQQERQTQRKSEREKSYRCKSRKICKNQGFILSN